MRRSTILIVPLLMAAGACDQRAPAPTAQQTPTIRIANPYHDQLAGLRPNLQRIAMMRAIRQNGNACQSVENAGYQEEYRNMRLWVAQCGGPEPKTWQVYLAPNGDVQVRDCADAGELSLPRCQPLPPAQPDQPLFKEGAANNAFRGNSF